MSGPTEAVAIDWMVHMPALQVAVPMLGATITAIVRKGPLCSLISLVICLSMPVISALILHDVLVHGTISYAMGSWQPPVGIEYRIDALNGFVLFLVSLIAALVAIWMPQSIADEVAPERQGWTYTMYLMALCGLLGMTITGDAFNIFVFMEISSLATYVLIAMGQDRRALVAAYQYLIIGTIGATFYVIGVGILFSMTGTLNLNDMAQIIPTIEAERPILAGGAFIIVGIGLKLALFPLHRWLPNAYAFAPSSATVFLAATATKVAVYLLIRFTYSIFGDDLLFDENNAQVVLLILASLGMVMPSIIAVFQVNVKKMLAFSSVSQVGYMLMGIGIANVVGLTGGIAHMFNHAIIKAALFLAIGCVVYSTGIRRIEQLNGIGRTMPFTMAAFAIAGMGLIGVPGTAGFVSKWMLIQGAAEAGMWWLIVVIAISSVLAVFYIGRVIEVAWFRPPNDAADLPRDLPVEMTVITWIMALAVIYFGIDSGISVEIPALAAEALMSSWAEGGTQ
ncbi:MAG: monovalent cation/H+ antiporter subunit D family protein [Pseudomonadota bacterium]